MTDTERIEQVDEALQVLGEYFDAAQILVSWQVEGGEGLIFSIYRGVGSWHVRHAMAQEFLQRDQARAIATATKESNE